VVTFHHLGAQRDHAEGDRASYAERIAFPAAYVLTPRCSSSPIGGVVVNLFVSGLGAAACD